MTDITVIIPLHDLSNDYIEMTKTALDSVKECEKNYTFGKLIPMIVIPQGFDQPAFEGIEIKYVVNTTGKYDFCSQVNFAVDSVETEYFSILECDDTYAPKWFKMAHDYYQTHEDVSVFLPVNVQWSNGRIQWQYNNEIALASSFSNEMGFIDKDGLDVCSTFNLTGAVINTKDFIEVGKYKPSIKFAFNYELMLRFADNGMKMMVVPKEGYNHHVGRKNSLTDIYAKEIPESEIQLWFDLAKREYPYKIDRWKTIVMPKQEQLK